MNLAVEDLGKLIDASLNPYLVLDRRLDIVHANPAYLRSTGRNLADIVGRWAWDAFPTDADTLRQSVASFERVIATKQPDTMPLLKFDIPREERVGGGFEERWWSITHAPVFDGAGEVAYVLQHPIDVTELQRARQAAEEVPLRPAHGGILDRAALAHEQNLLLKEESRRLRALFDQAPGFIAILSGPDLRFEFVNEAYDRLFGSRRFVGKTVREAFPDLVAQGYYELLDRVYATGERFIASAMSMRLNTNLAAEPTDLFLDFIYEPVRDEAGTVTGIFIEGQNVTDRIRAEKRREALLRLDNQLRDVEDTADLSFAASKLLGEALGAVRVGYGAVDAEAGTITVERSWGGPDVPQVAGVYSFNDYGSYIDNLRRGESVRNPNVENDLRTAENADAFHALGICAHLDVPVVEHGRMVATMFVHSVTPRVWTDEEVAFTRDFAERTRAAIARRLAEQALMAAEHRLKEAVDAAGLSADFRALFEASPTPFLVVEPPDWTIVAANDARLRITNLAREAQIGRKLFDVFPDDPNDPTADGVRNLSASLERVVANRASDAMAIQRYAVRDKDGRFVERWWSPVNSPVLDKSGNVALVIHRVEDVTETVRLRGEAEASDQLARDQQALIDRLRASEAALRESEARYRDIVEGADDFAIVTLDDSGIITGWNSGAQRLLGFTEVDAVGRPGEIFFTPEDRESGAVDHEMDRAASEGRAVNERWHLRKDGSRFWGSGLMMRRDGGGYLKIFRDRTAEHEAEAALRQSEAQQRFRAELGDALRGLTSQSEIMAAVGERLGPYLGVDQANYYLIDGDRFTVTEEWRSERSAGFLGSHRIADFGLEARRLSDRKELLRLDDTSITDGADGYAAAGMVAVLSAPLHSGGRWAGGFHVHSVVPRVWTDEEAALVRETAERAWAEMERVRAEASLRESEARQALLLELSDAFRSLSTPTEIASAAAKRLGEQFNLSRVFYAEYVGSMMRVERDFTRGVGSIVGEHDLSAFGPELLLAYHECSIVKVDDVASDERFGEQARAGLRARQVGAYLDVVLFENEQRVSLLAFQSEVPRKWNATEESLFREVGQRVKAAIERARADEQLRELNETLEQRVIVRTAERNRVWEMSRDLFAIMGFDGYLKVINPAWIATLGFEETTLLSRPFSEQVHPDDHEAIRSVLERLRTGETIAKFEDRLRHADGSWRWISWTLVPEDDLFYAVGRDVTLEKDAAAELAQAQEALRQSQKMEAMGSLTGGVAHDFNNLLTPIIGSLDMLVRKGVGSERERRLIDGALQSAERAKTLVQRLLAFARRQPLQPVAVDIGRLVDGMTGLISSTVGPAVVVSLDLAADLPPAKADPNQLEMALLNLAVNARDAMRDGGELKITAKRESVPEVHTSGAKAGHYIRLCVTDTGIGMDQATLARAIEPFFSTKGVGKGTGLGLSMVHGLAAQLGGGLTIESEPGRGTTIELWLPISGSAVDVDEETIPASPTRVGRGTALLVDDEELVRMSTADMLIDLGFGVVEASSAEEALRLLKGGTSPDLLVTDHLMPGMNGAELASEARLLQPAMPILVVSGYAEVEGIAPEWPRLTKPFRNAELAASLAALMP